MRAQLISRVALCIVISLIVLQACQSRKKPSIDAQQSTEANAESKIFTKKWIVKATASECMNRGGQFVEPASTAQVDIVDCLISDPTQNSIRGEINRLPKWGPRIVGNVYDYLFEPGTEKPGCGLYSYVLFPVDTSRSESLLDVVFATMSFVERSGLSCNNLNVLYLPTKAESWDNLLTFTRYKLRQNNAAVFIDKFYDYALARQLLGQVCLEPPNALREVCATDLSRGPYLFTYSTPVSAVSPVPPPFLFVDLSNVHERAFKEFVAAYKEQVKRANFNDRERIDTFRLGILSIVLTAADWVGPIRGAVADTLHLMLGGDQD